MIRCFEPGDYVRFVNQATSTMSWKAGALVNGTVGVIMAVGHAHQLMDNIQVRWSMMYGAPVRSPTYLGSWMSEHDLELLDPEETALFILAGGVNGSLYNARPAQSR